MIRDKKKTPNVPQQTDKHDGKFDICEKHKHPQVIFCDESNCQTAVCHTCLILKHRDHKLVEVSEKTEKIMKEMDTTENAIKEALCKNRAEVEKLDEIRNTICMSANEALDKIEEEKKKLIDIIEKCAEGNVKDVLEIQENEVRKVEEALHEVNEQKAKLEKAREVLAKVKPEDSIRKMIVTQAVVRQLYREGHEAGKDTGKSIKCYHTTNYKSAGPEVQKQFTEKLTGSVITVRNEIDQEILPNSTGASGQQDNEARHAASSLLQGVDQQLTVVKVNSWRSVKLGTVTALSSSPTGTIYIASENTIQSFDLDGNIKMEKGMTDANWIDVMTCHHSNGRDLLVLVVKHYSLQLRDANSGDLLDTLNIPGVRQQWALCQESPNSILVAGHVEGYSAQGYPALLHQIIIKNNKLLVECKVIYINLDRVLGLTIASRNGRKLVVATYAENVGADEAYTSSVIAVDYENGHELWRINEPCFNGKMIWPIAICTDEKGHLFVEDNNASRVILMDTEGNILKAICTDLYGNKDCAGVACIPGSNKLIVADDTITIYVYDIMYPL